MRVVSLRVKYLVPVSAVLCGLLVIVFPDHYAYYMPVVLICTLLSAFAKQASQHQHLVIWVLLFLSIFLGGSRGAEDIVEQSFDPIRILRIGVLLLLTAFVTIRLLTGRLKQLKLPFNGTFGWFLTYTIAAMGSAFYSEQPFVSLWKAFEIFACLLVAVSVYAELRSYQDMKTFWNLNIFFLVLLVFSAYIGAVALPGTAFHSLKNANFSQLTGLYPPINANSLTQMAAIVIAIYTLRTQDVPEHKGKSLLIVLCAIPIIVLSGGRTSILALCIALLIVFMLEKKYRSLFFTASAMTGAMIAYGVYLMAFFERGGSLYSLTGRLNYWSASWEILKSSPFWGHGFYTASRIIFANTVGISSFSTTDNTYLDVLLSIGIIGFLPFLLAVYSFVRKLAAAFRASKAMLEKAFVVEIISVAIIIFIRSLTGPSIQMLHWNLILFLAAAVCLYRLDHYESTSHT